LQSSKEQQKMESNADQQPEENKDIPNNNTELNKVREKREKVCIPFIYLPILERGKVCISLFIFQF
jgi:hypothetical protein